MGFWQNRSICIYRLNRIFVPTDRDIRDYVGQQMNLDLFLCVNRILLNPCESIYRSQDNLGENPSDIPLLLVVQSHNMRE